ncbi:hypothetical protein BGZ96_012286 [Linnemannia gamsii]|uniref:C2H2-type domain-containing protein n=1 Tax=Linnemannia gamsii TaxID=64522 RepID=A0ABQ7JS83_9FUNG|nr:hypothetical protein BGZ96_012286 [Linnemannia gamsii]
MAETTVTVASMDISMGLDTKPTDHHHSEKQGSFTIEAASPCEDVDMATPSAVSLNHSPPATITILKGAKSNIMLGVTPISHPLSLNSENNSLHHFQTNAASPMYTTPTSTNAYVHAALGPLLSDTAATVPSSATAAFMALHGHGVYESPRRNSVPTLTADQVEHKRKVSSEEKTLHRQASWSNFSSVSTPLSSFPTTTSLPNLHQIDTAHVDPSMMQYYRTQFSQQQALQHNTPHHTLNQALPASTNSSACPSPMPESLMQGSVLNSINSSPVAGTGSKKFTRADNHTPQLKSQSKRGAKAGGAAERRRRAAGRPMEVRRGSGSGDDAIKQESQDSDELQPVLSSQDPRDPEGTSSMTHHHHSIHGYGSGSIHHGQGEHDDGYSPTRSPGGTPMGHPSSMGEDEHFGMINHTGYSTFANNTLYSMNDPMEHLSGMVPRFDHIRLDLKSVAPSDKPSSAYDDESPGSGNPNGESPHPSPMPHYEQFAFPTSISTHFMPMMNGGFSMDHSGIHHPQQPLHHHPSSGGPDSASPSSYSSLPSADSSASSASSFHHHHHHGYHPDGYQFGANGLHSMNSDLHYPPASPMNEDGSINPHHSHNQHSHHHHPHPLHPQSFHHSHHHHSDFYDSKPLYSSTSSTSSASSSLTGSRATTTPDIINSKGSSTSTKSASSSSSSSTTSSTNGASGSTNNNGSNGSSGGSGSKHGGSGKHHTCSEIGCSKRFKRLEHLKRHIKTHTLERPFNCPYATCTKKFSRSDNLSQHVKTHQRQLNKLQMKQRNQAQAQQQQQQQAQQQAAHS